ncbi:MAG: thioredoxin [Candidatus Omnitrophota bacterium]|nr:thioredoxin [Candidatus Omnitrophota bacterium]
MSESILHLSDESFEKEVAQGKGVALVDFWASWCYPCKMIAPILEDIAKDYSGKIKVGKVEVDEAGATASRFNVMNIPTLILFKDGKEIERIVGVASKEDIARKIDKALK